MRIAFFGGTFDPPHRGHVAVARAAADRFGLQEVLFAPAARQPLKSAAQGADYWDRLAMTSLACAEDPRFLVSVLDAPRGGDEPSYTAATLARLRLTEPGAEIFALAGADSFHSLGRWRDPQQLLHLAEWIVVSRPGYALGDPAGLPLTPPQRSRIHTLDSVHEEVAATVLRERLVCGDPCEDLLPDAVSLYIQQHGLYLGPK